MTVYSGALAVWLFVTPIPDTQAQSESDHSQVIRIDRLGGLIHEYARAA
jgi:hypothetical protein